MRILLLCEGDAETHNSWSGISRSVLKHLRAAGHEVIAADADLHGIGRWTQLCRSFSPRRRRWWVRYHLGPSSFKARSRIASRHVFEWRDKVDVILQFGATFNPAGRGDLPVVLYCDSNIAMAEIGAESGFADASLLTASELARVFEREREVYEAAAAIMTFSDLLRDTFISSFSVPADRVVAVGAGPNLDFSAQVTERDQSSRPPTVLFVGRQFHRKGGDLLLRAFQGVRSRVPDARLVIVGPPTLDEELGEGVEFLGFLRKDDPTDAARLLRAYRNADVFCLPTRFEPYGVSFLEAMRFSIPCVGPESWAVPEMVVHEETGILVPPEDECALTEALVRLLTDRETARKMGEAGRSRAEQGFTWDSVVRRMEATLAGAIDRHRAPGGA